jgi:hypothetical protein
VYQLQGFITPDFNVALADQLSKAIDNVLFILGIFSFFNLKRWSPTSRLFPHVEGLRASSLRYNRTKTDGMDKILQTDSKLLLFRRGIVGRIVR